VWQRAAEMGRSIDPENPLYRVTPTVASASQAFGGAAAATAVATAVAQAMPKTESEPAVVEMTSARMDASDDMGKTESWRAPPTEDDNTLEFTPSMDTGWGDEPAVSPAAENIAPPAPEPAAQPSMDDTLVFESNPVFAMPEPEPEPEAQETGLAEAVMEMQEDLAAESPLETLAEEVLEPMPTLDFAATAEEIEVPAEAVPELDLSGIDLDLSTDTIETNTFEAESLDAAPLETPTSEETPLEFEPSLDFEPAEAAAPEELVMSEVLVPGPAAETESQPDDASIDPALREEVNTKLDLAKAYLEMGDREGAREILQEVLNEGDAGQKAEAGKLMAEAG